MNFSLDFSTMSKTEKVLFPLPSSNRYQQITNLILPASAEQLTQKNGQRLAIFWPAQAELSFKYHGRAIETDWSQIYFKKYGQSAYFNEDYLINRQDLEMKAVAEEWLGEETDLKKVVRLLYENTLAYLHYGRPIRDLYPYTQALTEQETDCGGFATFLATLLQSQGLPARLVLGYVLKNNLGQKIKKMSLQNLGLNDLSMHAWLEVQLADETWFHLIRRLIGAIAELRVSVRRV